MKKEYRMFMYVCRGDKGQRRGESCKNSHQVVLPQVELQYSVFDCSEYKTNIFGICAGKNERNKKKQELVKFSIKSRTIK